jgi:hypothetical protein
VTGGALGCRNRYAMKFFAKDFFESHIFGNIANRGAGGVSVYVCNFID